MLMSRYHRGSHRENGKSRMWFIGDVLSVEDRRCETCAFRRAYPLLPHTSFCFFFQRTAVQHDISNDECQSGCGMEVCSCCHGGGRFIVPIHPFQVIALVEFRLLFQHRSEQRQREIAYALALAIH